MDLQLVARVAALVLSALGVVFVGTGAFGIFGQHCVDVVRPAADSPRRTPDAPREEVVKPLHAPTPSCDKTAPVTIVAGYVLMDTFFSNFPAGSGRGMPQQVRWRLSRLKYKTTRRFRTRPVGLDNVIFANSLGIKAAFVLGFLGCYTTIFVLLSVKQIICFLNPRVVLLEKLAMSVGVVAHIAAGILGAVWGAFAHLSPEELRPATSLICPGWLLGGLLFAGAGLVQVLDIVLSAQIAPVDQPPPAADADSAKSAPTAGVCWQSKRMPPPGYDHDFYSRHDQKKAEDKKNNEDKTEKSTKKDKTEKSEKKDKVVTTEKSDYNWKTGASGVVQSVAPVDVKVEAGAGRVAESAKDQSNQVSLGSKI